MHVSVIVRGVTWEMIAFYANLKACKRRQLWSRLDELQIGNPWLVLGDFNCILWDEERSSKRGASSSFQSWVSRNDMMDLGYEGTEYTWNHESNEESRRLACLDRALCDDLWRHLFPMAFVKHLTHSYSNHCPLLLELEEGREERLGARPFRFEAAWLLHKGFEAWLKREWLADTKLTAALKDLTVKLRTWNQDTFSNIFRRKRRNEQRLGGV